MKKTVIWLITLMLLCTLCITSLVACDDSSDKQTPVYLGMSISSTQTVNAATYNSAAELPTGGKQAPGEVTGDFDGRNETPDAENPYPENGAGETVEQEIESSLNVVGAPDEIFCTAQNQDVYIHVHIDNPDNFEIMSFALNGKKYSNYMFEDGSDMETLVLKYNVGDAVGIVEYTIDAIKYVDGTEIKDVLIEGNKTVKAGIRTENQVTANVKNVNVGTDALSFDVKVKDDNGLLAFSQGTLKAVLYDGESIVSEKDIALGDNTVSFTGLKTNTLYQYAIVGYYDALFGTGFGMNVLHKEALYTDPVVLFNNVTVSKDGVSFGFTWHEEHQGQSISAIKLYRGDTLEKTVAGNATSVTGLRSATSYKMVAEYQNASALESICIEFTTLGKVIPDFSVHTPTKTQTSVGFEVSETDTDNVGAISKIELVHANGTTVAASNEQRTFTELLSGNNYTVKVTYTYDLNDGTGAHDLVKEISVTTDVKVAPSIIIKEGTVTTSSINADHETTDVDHTITSCQVSLYKGSTLVSTNANKKLSFSSLSYYTTYTAKITYTYDLNDGAGVHTEVVEKSFTTYPYINVTECNILNTDAVFDGDTIFMQIKLDNPSSAAITSVVINGETYAVTGASTGKQIFVEIVCGDQFAGGNTYLKVDRLNAVIGDLRCTATPTSNLADSVFINGKIDVLKVEIVNKNFEVVDWAFPGEQLYMMLTLDNPTGYTVTAVNDNTEGITMLDSTHVYLKISDTSPGPNTHGAWYLSYANAYISNTQKVSGMPAYYVLLGSNEIKYVSTADELKQMYCEIPGEFDVHGAPKRYFYYYELTGDIDLAGLEWQGAEFAGVLNGKGYAIKNMTSVSGGLFHYATGVIEDLHLQNATILSNNSNIGGFTDRSYRLILDGCTVDQYSTFTSWGAHDSYIGGLIGYHDDIDFFQIKNCTNNATITSSNGYAGGLVGYGCGFWAPYITNSVNNGDVSGSVAGGFVGVGYNSDFGITITNCTNNGDISASGRADGFVGASSEDTIITNCINNGAINGFIGFRP